MNWKTLLLGLCAALVFPEPAAAADTAYGQYLASECVTCHRADGQVVGAIPAIIGWPQDQFVAVLKSYKDKTRDNVTMQTIAGKLTDDDMAALAAYYSALKPAKRDKK